MAKFSTHIFRSLLREGPQSKSEMAQACGTSIPTVTKIINTWCDKSLIRHQSHEGGHWGKYAGKYFINPDYCYYMSLNIRPDFIEGAVCNTIGEVQRGTYQCYHYDTGIDNVNRFHVVTGVKSLIYKISKSWQNCFDKILIACHGTVRSQNRGAKSSVRMAQLHWNEELDLVPILEKEFQVPILLESDCITLAHSMIHQDPQGDFIFVHLDYGIAASLVLDYRVWGSDNGYLTPGQIGHTPITDDGILCKCGNYGCLETIANSSAIVRSLSQELKRNNSSSLMAVYRENGKLQFSDVVRAVLDRDPLALRVCSNAIHYIALVLVGLIHFVNVPRVYLYGALTMFDDFLLEQLYATVGNCSIYQELEDTQLELVAMDKYSMFRGLACRELYRLVR